MSENTKKKIALIMACGIVASSMPMNVFANKGPDYDQESGIARTNLILIKKTEDGSNQTVLTLENNRNDDLKTSVSLNIKRAEAPTGIKECHISAIGSKDGSIVSIPAETEYRIGEEGEWLPVPDGGELTELGTGTVYIRTVSKVKGFPAGNSTSIEIKSDFADAKETRKSECNDMMFKNDSEACRNILEQAIDDINDLAYNINITLEENIAAIEGIKTQFETDLIAQRKTEYEAQFEEFKNIIIEEIDKMASEDDSDDAKQLIESAKTEIEELVYDYYLELFENKANAESLLINLIVNLEDQRGTDRHEAFGKLKEYYINKLEEGITEETSEAVKSIISEGKENINALEYDDKKNLSENKDILETLVNQINDRIKTQIKAEEDAAEVSAVEAKIAVLSEVEYTEDFYNKVKEAGEAYDALSEKQQALVTNYPVYEDAKKALEAVYDTWRVVKEATCVENGIQEKLTSNGTVETQELVSNGGHKYGLWTITELATDEKDGIKVRVCETCGETEEASTKYDWHDEGESGEVGSENGEDKVGTLKETTDPDTNAFSGDIDLTKKEILKLISFDKKELERLENGSDISIKLKIKDITKETSEDGKKKFENSLKNFEHLGAVLDITIAKYIDDEFVSNVSKLNKPVTITIEIPESLYSKDRDFSIVRDHDGKLDKIDLEPVEGKVQKLKFGSEVFSTYYITYVDNKEAADTIINKTNDIKKDITEYDDSTEAIQKILDETKQAKEDFAELTDKQKDLVTNQEDLLFIENVCALLMAEKNNAAEAEAAKKEAEAAKKEAEAAKKEAEAALTEAEEALKTANEKAEAAEATVSEAMAALEKAESAANEKQDALEKAENAAKEAQEALETAEKEAAEAMNDANKDAEAAEKALILAQKNADQANEAMNAAKKEFESAKNDAYNEVASARSALDLAVKDAEAAKKEAEAAKKATEEAMTEAEAAKKEAEAANTAKEAAEKEAKDNKDAYDQAVLDLAEAEELIDKLKEEVEAAGTGVNTDQTAAEVVIALINDIKEIARTEECKESIVSARSAYDKLTDTQKALVINYDALLKAEEEYAALPEELPKTGFSGIHNAIAGFATLMTTAGAVILKKRRKEDEED